MGCNLHVVVINCSVCVCVDSLHFLAQTMYYTHFPMCNVFHCFLRDTPREMPHYSYFVVLCGIY